MALFRNIMIVGALALVIPADTDGLRDTASGIVSGTVQIVDVATAAVSDAAGFCERNADLCAEIAESPRTVRVKDVRRDANGTQVISRNDVNTTILVRAAG